MARPSSPLLDRVRASALVQAGLIGLLAFLVRSAHLSAITPAPVFQAPTADEFEHWDLALKLADGNWLGEGLGPYFRPQLFAYVLAMLQLATGKSLTIIHLLLAMMDAVTVAITYLVFRRICSRTPALIGAGLLALYSPGIFFAGTLNKESFGIHLQAWLLLALAGWVRAASRHRSLARHAVLVGLLLGLGLLVRPAVAFTAVALGVALPLLCGNHPGERRRAILSVAGMAATAALVLLPQAVRNFTVGGAPVIYSTHGWLNLYLGNNDDGKGLHDFTPGIAWDLFIERPQMEGLAAAGDYGAVDRYWRSQTLSHAARNPVGLVGRLGGKLVAVFNAQESGVTNNLRTLRELSPVQRWFPGTGLLLPPAILGLWLCMTGSSSRGRRRFVGLLSALVALTGLLAAALVFPVSRDRLAGCYMLIPFAGIALHRLATSFRPKDLALLVVAAAFVNIPWPVAGIANARLDSIERWQEQINRGDALLILWRQERKSSQIRGAVETFETALRMRPEGLQAMKQLPAAYVRAGREADALAAQTRLTSLLRGRYPANRYVRGRELGNLARMATEMRRPADAERAARELVEVAPDQPEGLDILAMSLAAQGKAAEAHAVAERRCRDFPADPAGERLVEAVRGALAARRRPSTTPDQRGSVP